MSYQVLARKYRPQTFAEVVGQEHISQTLKNAIEASRLHHAYLFTGARGIGKTTVARILAKALNCQKPNKFEPCNKCSPCVSITNGNFMDVQEIDGASNTGVDDVREIREKAKYLPSEGKYKIYVIDEVHMLSNSAFNALLKTLEEPPAHVIFVFATTEPHKIPPTILSRCQRYDFRRISFANLCIAVESLAKSENVKIDEDSVSLIAKEAEGSMRDAQSLFDQIIAYTGNDIKYNIIKDMLGFMDHKTLYEVTEAILQKDAKKALGFLEEVFGCGIDLQRFAIELLENIRHLLIVKTCKDTNGILELPESDIKGLQELSQKTTVEELEQLFRILYRGSEEIARSKFPKMLLEVLLIRMVNVKPVVPIDALIKRLESLSAGVVNSGASVEVQNKVAAFEIAEVPASKRAKPSGDNLHDNFASKTWPQFLTWLKTKRPQVVSILENGTFVGFTDKDVKIAYANGSIYGDMLTETERKTAVEGLLKEFFNRTFSLDIIFDDVQAGQVSLPSKKQNVEEKRAKRREIVEEAISSNLVKEAADILNAEVKDVKTNV